MSPRPAPYLLLLAACGGGGGSTSDAPDTGLIHLDPRLSDGRSSAWVLAGVEERVRSWTVEALDPDRPFAGLAPWDFDNAIVVPTDKHGGLAIQGDYRPAEGVVYTTAQLGETVDSADFNRVEVDVAYGVAGSAVLTWEAVPAIEGLEPGALRAETVSDGGGVETIAFDLAGHPGWRGQARGLKLFPCWRGAQSYELLAIRFLRVGFSPGAQPSAELGGLDGDGGLVGPAGDLRRTWPTDDGVPLYASARVPPEGRVVVDVALPGRLHGAQRPAHFAIDVRADEDEPWVEQARRSVLPGRYPERARWAPLGTDLSAWAGDEVDLRFRAWLGDAARPAEGGELREARLWWGNPLVLGAVEERAPDLLLITLDTLRTDAIGCYGGKDLTPFLDELAEEGLLFEDAWCACNSTLPSHTSLLTGLPVPTHGVLDNRSTLASEVPTLAQALRAAGYHTAAAVSVEHLQAGWSGLGRGFDQYLDVQPRASVDGAVTVRRVIEWNEAWAAQGDRPVFLWLHLFDPHTPYDPPRDFLVPYVGRAEAAGRGVPPSKVDPPTIGETGYTQPGKFLEGVTSADFASFLYEASVAYTDELVRDVVWSWRETGRWDDTLCVVTADHGESLGEQGVWYGHQLLHTPVMHVPLIVRTPEGRRGRVAARAWNPDVARTVVETLGLEGIEPAGTNLFALAERDPSTERRVWFVHSGLDQAGCRDEDVHYWHNVKEYGQLGRERAQAKGLDFVYRHDVDPGLLTNLRDVEPETAARYANAMREWLARAHSGRRVPAQLTDADRQRLEDMGYGGGDEEDAE